MSRIAPKPSSTGKLRRLTANWAFENIPVTPEPSHKTSLTTGQPRNELQQRMNASKTEVGRRKKDLPPPSYDAGRKRQDYLRQHENEPASVDDSFNDAMSDGTDSGLGSGWCI
jgi:hypothetical protein